MPRILIANIDNDDMLADRSSLTYEFCCHSVIAASKHVWFADPGDIVVLPEGLSKEMYSYISMVKDIPVDSINVIAPTVNATDLRPIDTKLLEESNVLDQLLELTKIKASWSLHPYHHDRVSNRIARELGFWNVHSTNPFLDQGGADLLNDKKLFRSLAAGRGIRIAEGEVVRTETQLLTAFERLIGKTGAVIIKQNRHSGCLVNMIVSTTEGINQQGASDALVLNDRLTLPKAATAVWNTLGFELSDVLIVESYYPVRTIGYVEFEIEGREIAPIFLTLGEQRMEPLFCGFEIPGRIPVYQQARMVANGAILAKLAQDLGYTGFIDMDAIFTNEGELFFCEINARYSGVSHIHHLAVRLLGADYGGTHTILARNGVRAPLFADVLAMVEDWGLVLKPGSTEGILFTAEDTRRTGTLDYMVAAKTRARAYEVEKRLLESLTVMGDLTQAAALGLSRHH